MLFAVAIGCMVGLSVFGGMYEGFHIKHAQALGLGCAAGLSVGAILFMLDCIYERLGEHKNAP